MSTKISPTLYAILGAAMLLAILAAGCTGSPSASPQTAAPTTAPATPATMPMAVTTTPPPTTMAPAGNVTESPATVAATPPAPTATPAPTTSLPAGVPVAIQNYGFNPQTVTVPVGTTVTWTNLDTVQHQITDSSTTLAPGLLFISKPLGKGDSYSFTFTSAGTYQYYCMIHPYMRGTIFVT